MIGQRPVVHYPWNYFEELAKWTDGIERVDITGGEPTCHPQFAEFVPKFKALFGCKRLTLETNGFQARKYADALRCFDFIRLGRYPENGSEIDWLIKNFPAYQQNGSTCVEIHVAPDVRGHVPRLRRGGGGPCHLGYSEFALYTDGKFWPCRLGSAIPMMQSLVPCEDWREKIAAMSIPCEECFFSPSA